MSDQRSLFYPVFYEVESVTKNEQFNEERSQSADIFQNCRRYNRITIEIRL